MIRKLFNRLKHPIATPLTYQEESAAYRFLTRELRTLHASERDNLDVDPNLPAILRAVHEGRDLDAIEMTNRHITDAGRAWRAKQGIHYTTNGRARG